VDQEPASRPVSQWAPLPESIGPQRPLALTLACLVLGVLGILALLVGALMMLGGQLITEQDVAEFGIPGLTAPQLAGFAMLLGALIAVYGLLEIVAGIGAYSLREWARLLAFVLIGIGLLIGVVCVLLSFDPSAPQDQGAWLAAGLVLLAAYAFPMIVLGRSGALYQARLRP
jgi:hypothetical protein